MTFGEQHSVAPTWPGELSGYPWWVSEGVEIAAPTSARVYDFALGGLHNFAVDRALWHDVLAAYPPAQEAVYANRAFIDRTVTALLEAGVRQFVDLGAGIPTAGSIHEIVQNIDPTGWTVYVDIDPIAVTIAQDQLEHTPYAWALHGDLRHPHTFLDDLALLLDLSEPVAVLAGAVLHAIPDTDQPTAILDRIAANLVHGSYLALTHATCETSPARRAEQHAALGLYERTAIPLVVRTAEQITGLLGDAWEILPPGVTTPAAWYPEPGEPAPPCPPSLLATVARRRPTPPARDRLNSINPLPVAAAPR
jgi:hypothetical protein